MEKSRQYIEVDLFSILIALWHRAWAIVLAMIVFGAAAFSYAAFMITPLYRSSALMYVNNSSFSVGSTEFSISSSELTAAQSLVDTYVIILKTRTTLEEVIQRAQLDYSYEELSGMISAAAVNSTEIFEIVVTSNNPQEAEQIANTITEVLPKKISNVVEGSSVRIVDYAVVPSMKSSPNVTMFTAIGILLGFVASCFVIVLLELFDEYIHTEDYLIQTYGLPVLAVIPDLFSSKGSSSGYYKSNYKMTVKNKGKEAEPHDPENKA